MPLHAGLFTIDALEYYGKVNCLKGGLIFSDFVTTVSRKHAEEIQTPEYGYGLEGVLPDGKVGRIGREAVPLLREKNYSGAMLLMTKRVADAIAAGRGVTLTSVPPIPESGPEQPSGGIPLGTILFLFFVFGLPTLGLLLPLLLSGALTNPRRRGYVGRRPWIAGGYWPGTWGGGGFSGGGSGWGGGGGFGGFGGGSFGGGGASGSW